MQIFGNLPVRSALSSADHLDFFSRQRSVAGPGLWCVFVRGVDKLAQLGFELFSFGFFHYVPFGAERFARSRSMR
jgi:hypothetical protein